MTGPAQEMAERQEEQEEFERLQDAWAEAVTRQLVAIAERLDRIEATMLKREDLHVSNRSRSVDEEWASMAEWEAAQAGEHREGGE